MRNFIILVILNLLSQILSAQTQVTITLISDTGVYKCEYLDFAIESEKEKDFSFKFKEFPNNEKNSNPNLFQYSKEIETDIYNLEIKLKSRGTEIQTIIDSLQIDKTISRVELFIYFGIKDSLTDCIREIKILRYFENPSFLKISNTKKLKLGSKAIFNVENVSKISLYSYPNNAFFFGSLYKEIGKDSWTKHYPQSIEAKFCDTISNPKILKKKEKIFAFTPNDNNCGEYQINEKGKYFFELYYSLNNNELSSKKGITKIRKIDIGRQIFMFKI